MRSAIATLVFTVIPAIAAYWYLFSVDPPIPLLRRELSVLGSPDVDLVDLASLLLAIPLLIGLGLIVYIAKVVRRRADEPRAPAEDAGAGNVMAVVDPDYGLLTGTPEHIESQKRRIDRDRVESERTAREVERQAELDHEREKLAIRRSADGVIALGTEIMSDGVLWVWDGELAHARCLQHPGTDLIHRANGAGAITGPPADRSSLMDDHLGGGHLFCPEHPADRRSLGEPETYGEARQRAEDAMRAASRGDRSRSVFDIEGSSLAVDGVQAKNHDTVIKAKDSDIDAKNIVAE